MPLRHAAPLAVAFVLVSVLDVPAQPASPAAMCTQQFLPLREERDKRLGAVQEAINRKAPPPELCRVISQFYDAEAKMIKYVEENGVTCNVPPDMLTTLKAQHSKAANTRSQVCAAAARPPPRPAAPSLSDALGAPIPDASTTKTGRGTLDSLSGNPLAR